ncbi:DNA-binding protein [Streptomyces sp. NBC_00654]|uniref:helix-turn-helix domain-containing protein n=1 Tax=Streptomyces sp. NBC_00654 TaxID=2975799 RepID=UPI00225C1C78|nr:DNA-binding protein [Streptomyces sp. NBC_00654]MCX4968914.1 DNA-binding protein [Streptomyces sp. NBC_00654]
MSMPPRTPLSFTEVFELPVAVDMRTAARALGICTGTAYQLVRRGAFPCPVLRIGGVYRVPTTPLMRVLGIEERPLYAVDLEGDQEPDDGTATSAPYGR